MAEPTISETQFVFGYFHHYQNLYGSPNIRFIFPTLREEGNFYNFNGGADLIIGNLFLQFKTSHYLQYLGSSELRRNLLAPDFLPYFRFSIKNEPYSYQFDKLKNTAFNPWASVKYIAPLFYDEVGFFNFYYTSNSTQALNQTINIDFKQFITNNINLNQTNEHVISYNINSVANNYGFLFSEPQKVKIIKGIDMDKFEPIKYRDLLNNINKIFYKEFNLENNFIDVQKEILLSFNIHWIPIINIK